MADVRKNIDRGRFEVLVDGEVAGYTEYEVGSGVITLPHTVVEERFGGQGLAGLLVQFAVDDIRAEGYLVHPVCSYVKKWLHRHPEYADLVAPGPDDDERQAEGTDDDLDGADQDLEQVAGVDASHDPRI